MSISTIHLKAIVYRAHHPGWAFSPASGEGAELHGGRFNEVGVPTLYTSRDEITAITEAQQGFARKAQPMTLCGYAVDCIDIVDLTDSHTLTALGVSNLDLGCAWEDLVSRGQQPPTWNLARNLVASGASGIIVRSFASGMTDKNLNVVFWDWSEDLPHQVVVIDDHGRLPEDRGSWN